MKSVTKLFKATKPATKKLVVTKQTDTTPNKKAVKKIIDSIFKEPIEF